MLSSVHPIAVGGSKSFVDIKYDPSGQQLATTSSEGSVHLWPTNEEVLNQQQNLQATAVLKYHEGPVWTIAFAPPQFGNICATGGYDRRLVIWKDFGNNSWQPVFCDDNSAKSSITCVDFCAAPGSPLSQYQTIALPQNAPLGLHLASASLDGLIVIYSLTNNGSWTVKSFVAHMGGVRTLAWSKTESAITDLNTVDGQHQLTPQHRLASGGIDGVIRIWRYDVTRDDWGVISTFQVRLPVLALAWQPATENQRDVLAVLTDDGTVAFWERDDRSEVLREAKKFARLSYGATKISWSLDGLLLAVPTSESHHVWMIRENSETRQWELCNTN